MHLEMVYKKNECEVDRSLGSNFSFEIDETNNMIVPNNVNAPIQHLNFVRLPNHMELYKESGRGKNMQWKVDRDTV